jgi:quinol monooxygenase YgiN
MEPGAFSVSLADRRAFLTLAGAALVAPLVNIPRQTPAKDAMYGLIGKIKTVAGQRDALAAILLGGTGAMPGCLSYVVATDPKDPDALWVTEVWESQESHQASLKLAAVQDAIAKGRPLIAGFSDRAETVPLGGYGLRKA